MAGGINFGVAAPLLARVVDNGVTPDDSRVIDRTNAATKLILDHMIPVGGMATFNVTMTGNTLFLPKELENAIEVQLVSGTVNGQDTVQGWTELVNNFAYVDPYIQHDNPLVDQFLQPDPVDPTILRRQYLYPNATPNSTVTVTGAKRYIPIKGDSDYLIVQNIEALKRVILSIERVENNATDEADKLLKQGLEILEAEVKKHMLDPSNVMKRKAAYQADVVNFPNGSLGNTRGRIALEVPGYLKKGKTEINYAINHATSTIIDAENALRFTNRLGVHESINEIPWVPAVNSTDMFITLMPTSEGVIDFDIIRRLCVAYDEPDLAKQTALEDLALKTLEQQLTERLEVKRHQDFSTTFSTATPGTVAWTVARLALETPTGLKMSVFEVQNAFEMAEKRLIDMGKYKDTIDSFTATVINGDVFFPPQVESVLAINLDGTPIPIRSIFFQYLENGPGQTLTPTPDSTSGFFTCGGAKLVDDGEQYFPENGLTRRKYHLETFDTNTHTISVVAKVRWFSKAQDEPTTIKNFEALRLMFQAVVLERSEKWQDAAAAQAQAKAVLDRELHEFLAGIQRTVRVQTLGWGAGLMQHGTL